MSTVPSEASAREVPQVRPSHGAATIGAAFDDPSLTASAGLVPLFAPAEAAGLPAQATAHVEVQADRGTNANLNAMSIEPALNAFAITLADRMPAAEST